MSGEDIQLKMIDTTREEKNGRWFLNVAADTHQKGAL